MLNFKSINWATVIVVSVFSLIIAVCSVAIGMCLNEYMHTVHQENNTKVIAPEPSIEKHREEPKAPKEPKEPTVITVECTAYTAAAEENGGRGDGMTASGVIGTPHYTCAADDLPFGTKLEIDGKIWVVQDRFGGGYTGKVDLLMNTADECNDFGRQTKRAVIIEG